MNAIPRGTNPAIRTPRAAAVAGMCSRSCSRRPSCCSSGRCRRARRTGVLDRGGARRKAVSLSLQLLPFAGIAFLWFIGVLRDRIGSGEDRFFATVFLGSGLLLVAMFFTSGAVAGGLISTAAEGVDRRTRQRVAVRSSQLGLLGLRVRPANGGGVHHLGDHTGHSPAGSCPGGWRSSATPPQWCCCSASVSSRGSNWSSPSGCSHSSVYILDRHISE